MTATASISRSVSVTVALARRSLTERRKFIGGLSIAMVLFAVMVCSLYPSMGVAYDDLLAEMPSALQGMFGTADFGTAEGFIQVELFSFMAPAMALAAGVSVAASSLAGAEQDGRLALITASPVRRSQIVSGTIAASVGSIAIVSTALFFGMVVGNMIGDLGLSLVRVAAACISLALLAIAVAMITVAAGAFTGKRGVAIGTGVLIAVLSYAIDAFFPLSATLEPVARYTLWYPYGHNEPLVHGLDLANAATLIVFSMLAAAVAGWAFERRDLG